MRNSKRHLEMRSIAMVNEITLLIDSLSLHIPEKRTLQRKKGKKNTQFYTWQEFNSRFVVHYNKQEFNS